MVTLALDSLLVRLFPFSGAGGLTRGPLNVVGTGSRSVVVGRLLTAGVLRQGCVSVDENYDVAKFSQLNFSYLWKSR